MSRPWSRYYSAAGQDPRETLLAALERFDAEGRAGLAVDLGCGTGRDTFELLRRGWRVLAIDAQSEALELLREREEARSAGERLQTEVASFVDATWPEADLVTSSFSLPFCPPDRFPDMWARIVASLRPGGRVCGQLFGDRDEWATREGREQGWSSPTPMTFHTREEVEQLLDGLDVEELNEVDEDGATAIGDRKHWHLFHVVARKPG